MSKIIKNQSLGIKSIIIHKKEYINTCQAELTRNKRKEERKMKNIDEIKDPVLRAKVNMIMENPSGSVAVELTEQDMEVLSGAGWWSDFSASLGNKGKHCTLTKECQACCN